MLKLGINGFGRIGRLVLRALLEKKEKDINVLAVNDLGNLEQNIHLLKYDTVHGKVPFDATFKDNTANIAGNQIQFYNERKPKDIPWNNHDIDVVLECTGIFTKAEDAEKHLSGSVKKVLISAPAKITLTPLPIAEGVFGIALTTLAFSPKKFFNRDVVRPPIIERNNF